MQNLPLLKEKNDTSRYAYVLYALSPLLSLFFAFKNIRCTWSKNLIWLFTIFYGFTFYIASDSGSDAVRYKDTLLEMSRSDLTLESLLGLFYSGDSQYIDIAQPLVTFIVARFTDNYQILFAVFGFFYGYLYSRNIWFLIDRANVKINRGGIVLLVVFSLIVSIASMNGLRFWMATHLFFFGMMPLIVEKKKSGLWIAASAILVHFSFLLPFALLLAYLMAGDKLKLYFAIFVFSFFISELNPASLQSASSYLPQALQDKSSTYLNEEYVQGRGHEKSNRSWFILFSSKAIAYAVVGFAILVFIRRKRYLEKASLYSLFSVGILFYGVFNILNNLPSLGRFLSLSQMLLISVFFWVIIMYPGKALNRILFLCMPGFMVFVVLEIRIMLGYSSYLLLVGNPVLACFLHPDEGLFQFIAKLF